MGDDGEHSTATPRGEAIEDRDNPLLSRRRRFTAGYFADGPRAVESLSLHARVQHIERESGPLTEINFFQTIVDLHTDTERSREAGRRLARAFERARIDRVDRDRGGEGCEAIACSRPCAVKWTPGSLPVRQRPIAPVSAWRISNTVVGRINVACAAGLLRLRGESVWDPYANARSNHAFEVCRSGDRPCGGNTSLRPVRSANRPPRWPRAAAGRVPRGRAPARASTRSIAAY
jgi:hypothetical protein